MCYAPVIDRGRGLQAEMRPSNPNTLAVYYIPPKKAYRKYLRLNRRLANLSSAVVAVAWLLLLAVEWAGLLLRLFG